MTRWIQEFNQHPFKTTWSTLLEEVTQLDVDDQTVTTTVQELARLKKVLVFVDGVITNADLELTPKSVWANSHAQAEACLQQARAYAANRNPAHLIQANEHADNLLTYVRPYMVAPEQALEAYGAAVQIFAEQVSGYVGAFQTRASEVQTNIATVSDDAISQKNEIEAIALRVKQFDAYLYDGVDGNDSAENYVKSMVSEIKEAHEQTEVLRQKLFEGPESTSTSIKTFETDAHELRNSLEALLGSATKEHKELEHFYERIFGPPKTDDQERSEGGLKDELDSRLTQLQAYEAEQNTRHSALFSKVESLLPGATSAGLSSSYLKLKKRFNRPIFLYTFAFNAALLALLVGGLVMISSSISFDPFKVEFVATSNWEDLLRTLLTRAPIVVPVVWFAIFSATRRSQYERLQQEYAHKEAFASSYESYKKQLQELQVNSDALQKELIAQAINAISYNPSKTLDGDHTEKTPLHKMYQKLSFDDFKKLLDASKGTSS
jgi:hypothetical protein